MWIKKILRFLWPERKKWNSYTGNTVSYPPMEQEKRLKEKMREALKNTVFHPPNDPDPVRRAKQQQILNKVATKAAHNFNAPDPSLSARCPKCDFPIDTPSIDDPRVECVLCKTVFMTKELEDSKDA